MSKIGKFYSLGIDMYKALPDAKDDPDRIYLTAPMLEKALGEVESFVIHQNNRYTEKAEEPTGKAVIHVTMNGTGILSEVRFYPILSGDTFETDYEETGRIDFRRFVTDEYGKLSADLPEGDYLLKVSKGSEYEIEYSRITINKNKVTASNIELKRFVYIESEGFFAGDLHHHSVYSSPVWGGDDDVIESPKEVADSMRAMGLTFGALSDHHNILNHKDWKATETSDFHPIPSKEISTSNGHVLSLGVDGYDVIYKIPEAKDRTESYLRNEFVRITDEIKEKGGLPQLNHPRDLSVSISWNRDFYDMTGIFQTVEIWNGSNPMYYGTTNSMAADFWRDMLEKGQFIPATTGSDTHNIRANDYHKIYGKLLWLRDMTKKVLSGNEAYRFEDSRYVLESFLKICDNFVPLLEVWAKTSLTSGCVRTYVNLKDGERPNNENVLDALRHGHSFLTNGPILIATVNGVKPGEKVTLKSNAKGERKADVNILLFSNRKLKSLTAYTGNRKAIEIPLQDLPTAKSYDYSVELKDFDLSEAGGYIFFVAASDVTNIAITNPVLLA